MPRPTLLQAIFQQPSQTSSPSPHVMSLPTSAAVPPRKGWRSSLSFRRSATPSAHYVDDNDSDGVQPRSPITGVAKTGAGTGLSVAPVKTNDRRGRSVSRTPAVNMISKADVVVAVPTLAFISSPSPVSSVTASPSPTPPLVSPASTPKSNSPSFTDETSDSSVEPEFVTPPSSPKPPTAQTTPVKVRRSSDVSALQLIIIMPTARYQRPGDSACPHRIPASQRRRHPISTDNHTRLLGLEFRHLFVIQLQIERYRRS